MPRLPLLSAPLLALWIAGPAGAQHAQTSAVAVHPLDPAEAWVVNRDNGSVSVVDVPAGLTVAEIDVGVWPRSIAFSPDGTRAFVANQRGNVPLDRNFVSPFDGTEQRGTISVIDTASRTVVQTLTNVGTEPYGLVVAPNGKYFAVTGHRSATVRFFDVQPPHAELLAFAYDRNLNFIPAGSTIHDLDSNSDFIPDLDEPRALTIRSDSTRLFVTHSLPGFVSVLDVTLDANGRPTAATLAQRIDLNTYPFHPIFNPLPVQVLKSQGVPRFLDDLALSPDGLHALVPHVLHNTNHDVNHDFGPGLAGDFANRVYPALSVVDTQALSFGAPTDDSARLHHELGARGDPAELIPFGSGFRTGGGILSLGGTGSPVLGTTVSFQVAGSNPADIHVYFWGLTRRNVPLPVGTLLASPDFFLSQTGPTAQLPIPATPSILGRSAFLQAAVFDPFSLTLRGLTNGIEIVPGTQGFAPGALGYRAGHPGKVLYNSDGDRAVLLNRGSEDVFLFDVAGKDLTLATVFPPRHGFVERAPFDTTTPLGDLPLGMALVGDANTSNRDALLYVVNEGNRTLSVLRIDWDTHVITTEHAQIGLLLGPDDLSTSVRIGQELFEDASRPQTAGNFNNSCGSCHFEGGADGNVWQRTNGPRSTIPMYGGSLATGLILWKGVRLNLGETGPMFAGENGGTGVLSDVEQQGLTDFHQLVPVPLNPNLDPVTGQYSANAALGRDLFFGTNDTGLNPTLRHAGCASCHPDFDATTMAVRGYTADFIDPQLTSGENLETVDPNCVSLRENIIADNIRNVNSGCNVDVDMDGFPDVDRNADGFDDRETYAIMNTDKNDGFERDDPNSYRCPLVPSDPNSPLRFFTRPATDFSIPTKLGVFSTGPYFHDHSVSSLRALLDPQIQRTDPVYGDPSFPGIDKLFNEFHDIRGNDTFVTNASKVQVTLDTLISGSTFEADIEAILEYIQSL